MDFTPGVDRPYFDRFDICEAAYVYAGDYNVGGFTALPTDTRHRDILGRLSRMHFKPGTAAEGRSHLSDGGREWYDTWAAMTPS